MGHDDSSLQTVDVGRRPSWVERLRNRLALPSPPPPAAAPTPPSTPPGWRVLPSGIDAEIVGLRDAVDRLDARLSHELVERDAKLLEELRRGMLGLETELSERFAASVLENRRAQRRAFWGIAALVVAAVGALLFAVLVRA